jgi:hypothetical protein
MTDDPSRAHRESSDADLLREMIGFIGVMFVAAVAIQNAVRRVHLSKAIGEMACANRSRFRAARCPADLAVHFRPPGAALQFGNEEPPVTVARTMSIDPARE